MIYVDRTLLYQKVATRKVPLSELNDFQACILEIKCGNPYNIDFLDYLPIPQSFTQTSTISRQE